MVFSVCGLIFLSLVSFLFWMSELGSHPPAPRAVVAPAAAPAAGD